MQKENNFFVKAAPLLLVLFIDGMGLGLVFPILNGIIFDPNSHFLSDGEISAHMHYVIYGLIVGIFMLCWFFGAAILGDLSDRIGRKKALIICLTGAFLSYIVSALSVVCNSLTLLIIGRVISGITAGSQPIAQAAIIDISKEEHKMRNMGYILLVLSLGFVFGPLLGGVLADKTVVPWFNFATPFYFASVISFLNIILLVVFFKETFVTKSTTLVINPYQAINIFISAFKHEKVRILSIIFFIFMLGWSSFYSFIALYLLKIYAYTPTKVSIFMALMGLGFGIGNGFLANFFAKFFSLKDLFMYSTLVTAIFVLCMVSFNNSILNWIIITPFAAVISIAYAAILSLFSNQVDSKTQGWVMGISASIMAFVFGVDGIIVGLIAGFNATLPIWIAGFSLLLAVFSSFAFVESKKNLPIGNKITSAI